MHAAHGYHRPAEVAVANLAPKQEFANIIKPGYS